MCLKSKIKLFFSYYSPPARAAYLVAKTLNLNVDLVHCDILTKNYMTEELVAINPQHCIPTLVDGDFVLWDSHAIAIYLINQYAINHSLYPDDPKQRGVINQRLHFDTGVLYPTMYQLIHPLIFYGKCSVPHKTVDKVKEAYAFLEKFLLKSTWLAGDNVTVADLCCMPNITSMDFILAVDSLKYPSLKNYIYQCCELPHYSKTNQVGLDKLGFRLLEMLVKEKGHRGSFFQSKDDSTKRAV